MTSTARTSRLSRSPFWVMSMVLHTLLLGWLVWYGPVRDIVLERGKPKREALIRGKELEKVVEQMQLSVAEELAHRVELLKAGQDRMATNFQTLNEHFQPFEKSQKTTALQRFEQYATALLADQNKLNKLLAEAAAKKNYDAAAQAGQEMLPVMISALDEVRRGVLLLTADESVAQLQVQAETALFEVEKPLRDIGTTLGRYRWLQSEIQQSSQNIASLKPLDEQNQKQLQTQKVLVDQLTQARKEAEDKFKELRKTKDRQAIEQANARFKQVHQQFTDARNMFNQFSRSAKDSQSKLTREQQRLDERQKALDAIKLNEDMTRLLNKAVDQLKAANTLENKVVSQVRSSQQEGSESPS